MHNQLGAVNDTYNEDRDHSKLHLVDHGYIKNISYTFYCYLQLHPLTETITERWIFIHIIDPD